MTSEPWWRRWPERLEWEEAELAAEGIAFRRHKPMVGDAVRYDLEYGLDGVTYEMMASFPDTYPYFRPIVVAATDFRFHQNVVGKELCLLARDPVLWTVDDSLASLIVHQLPKIVRANAADDEGASAVEEHVPEPVGETYPYTRPDVVFIDSDWHIPAEVDHGTLALALARPPFPLRAAVQAVLSADRRELATWDARLAPAFQGGRLEARWVRLADPIVAATADAFAEALVARRPDYRPSWQRLPGRDKVEFDLLGIVYNDEVRYATTSDDWVFFLRIRRPGTPGKSGRSTAPRVVETFLVQAMRAGPTDLSTRVPQLRFLEKRKVALFGLGALGAPSAVSLARAGIGGLALVEPDHVEAGTTPRWPLGLTVAGATKLHSITGWIQANWPFTDITSRFGWRLGTPELEGCTDGRVLDEVLDGADLVFDATANLAANHVLADEAWRRGLPLVQVTAKAGAWGGIVARFAPGSTCCELCFLANLEDKTIKAPPTDPDGAVTPIACSDTTFLGAGFDLTPLSDEAVRMGIATLSPGGAGDYPRPTWDVATLALRAEDGSLVPPTWTSFSLPPRPGCAKCGR